ANTSILLYSNPNSLGRRPKSLDPLYLDRILTLSARAVIMAYLDEVLGGNEVRVDQRVSVDARVVIFSNQCGFTVWAEQFHNHVGRTARVDPVAAVPWRAKAVEIFFAELADRCGGGALGIDFEHGRARGRGAGLWINLSA